MLGEKLLRKLYPNFDDEQYSVNGIDLKVGKLYRFPKDLTNKTINYMMNNKKKLPEIMEVSVQYLDGYKGYYLQPNESYSITTDRPMKIPKGYSQLYLSRSTLLRSNVVVNTAVGDSGFNGTLQFQIINMGKEPYFLGENDRFVQMVSFKLEGEAGEYDGDYQEGK